MKESRGSAADMDDQSGLETLELFADKDNFNEWLFSILAPYCKDNLLEIGSGIGNISALLEKKFSEVYLSDLHEYYCGLLRTRFKNSPSIREVYQLDLAVGQAAVSYPGLTGKFDTIIASNVIEHIEDDSLAVRNCSAMLKPGGQLVILVPAYMSLYNSFDKELGHYRRYTRKTLTALLEGQGLEVSHTQYFNTLGVLGWWFSGSVLKKKILPGNQLSLYNKLIPLIRVFDSLFLRKAGLSVIAVGKKNI